MKPRILFIDHADSFSQNLRAALAQANCIVDMVQTNDLTPTSIEHLLQENQVSAMVLSPGPGHPQDYRESSTAILTRLNEKIPVLGVCLGLQILLHADGAIIEKINARPEHGRLRKTQFISPFKLWPDRLDFEYFTYFNSLGCRADSPVFRTSDWKCCAVSDGFVAAIEHKSRPQYAVQFHPESFASPHGARIIEHFLSMVIKKTLADD